jgi:hypothetical protein
MSGHYSDYQHRGHWKDSNGPVAQLCKLINGNIWIHAFQDQMSDCPLFITESPSWSKVKLSLCLTNYALRHEGVWGSGCIDTYFLDLGTSWRWAVSFTPRPLYPRRKSLRYQLDRRLGGPQRWSGRRGEDKILDPRGTRTPNPRSSSP